MRTIAAASLVAIVVSLAFAASADGAEPEGAHLLVRVAHQDDTAIPHARITVLGPDAASGPPFAYRRTERADADGRARFVVPGPGVYDVEAIATGHRSVSTTIEVKDVRFGANLKIAWAAAPVVLLRVHVGDEGGHPIDGARIRVAREPTPEDEVAPHKHEATTGGEGDADLHIQGTGLFQVHVRHPRHEGTTMAIPIDRTGGGVARTLEVRLRAKPGATTDAGPAVEARAKEEPVAKTQPKATEDAQPEPKAEEATEVAEAGPGESAPADFSGRWRHASGTMLELVQRGAPVTGTWTHLGSTVAGRVAGRMFEFKTTSPEGLDCEGRVSLDASGHAFFGEAVVVRSASDQGRRFHFDFERQK